MVICLGRIVHVTMVCAHSRKRSAAVPAAVAEASRPTHFEEPRNARASCPFDKLSASSRDSRKMPALLKNRLT
jgi:hypothetical protein